MKSNKITRISAAIVCMMMLAFTPGCFDANYLVYDDEYNGVYFSRDTLVYSFSVAPMEVTEHTFMVPVGLMGLPSDKTREFAYEVITDVNLLNTLIRDTSDVVTNDSVAIAQEGVQYRLQPGYIPADTVGGYIPIVILRNNLEGDYLNGYVRYKLALRLVANEEFVPTLRQEDQIRVITFDNAIELPWKKPDGTEAWLDGHYGVWHPLKYVKMVEYFHELEKELPDTYKKMVELYGENLENVEGAWPYEFATTFNKYILLPTYEYFANPVNRDEILANYPDFPFDFPNPYGK